MRVLAVLVLFFTLCGCGGPTSAPAAGSLPEVQTFLASHQEFGHPVSVDAVPDWASGHRERVSFDNGRSLLFYTESGQVVTVYEDMPGAERTRVWPK